MSLPREIRNTGSFSAESVRVSSQQAKTKKTGGIILTICLAIAIFSAVLGPLVIGGASTVVAAETNTSTSAVVEKAVNSYKSVAEAEAELGFTPALPTMPENVQLTDIRVVDGEMLEMAYKLDNFTLLYRTAKGNSDLSDTNLKCIFTSTQEDVDGISRMYSGASETKVSVVVWTEGDNAYTLQASANVNIDTLRSIAESL